MQYAFDETRLDEHDIRPAGASVELQYPMLVELTGSESLEHDQRAWRMRAMGSARQSGSIDSIARRRRSRRSSNVPSGRGVRANSACRSASVKILGPGGRPGSALSRAR
ncbi:hypothetical protein ACNUCX_14695 [Curtobacterium flaccumfaciens pv. flaccumfaciens]|uniref:hypothetical protein n=1 Tax=Curtobacterium flaccumfaciens TaxID=2035 RepID=UPI003AB44CEF